MHVIAIDYLLQMAFQGAIDDNKFIENTKTTII